MATVVQQANRALQATLLLDADGYLLVSGVGGGGGSRPCPPPKEVIKTITKVEQVEVVREVPVEVIKEVVKEKPVPQIVEIVKEVPVEKRIEVIREVEGPERIVYRDKLVEVVKEVVKTEVREIIKEKPVYPTEEELERLLAAREQARLDTIRAAEEEARRKAEEEARRRPQPVRILRYTAKGDIKVIRGERGVYEPVELISENVRSGGALGDCSSDVCADPGATVPWAELKMVVTRTKDYSGNKANQLGLDSSYHNQPDWFDETQATNNRDVVHTLAGKSLKEIRERERLTHGKPSGGFYGIISQSLNTPSTLYGFLANVPAGAGYQFMWNALQLSGVEVSRNNGYKVELTIVCYDKLPSGWNS